MAKTGRNPINLETEEDWDGFTQHAATLLQKSSTTNVEIIINKEVKYFARFLIFQL